MNAILDLYAREPAMVLSSVGALVTALLVLLISFGVPITTDQRGAINAFIILVVTIGAGVVIRSRVTPVAAMVLPPH